MRLWVIYIFPRSVHIFFCSRIGRPTGGIYICSQTHECANWNWGPQFLFWEYLCWIFGIVSWQWVSNEHGRIFGENRLGNLYNFSWSIQLVHCSIKDHIVCPPHCLHFQVLWSETVLCSSHDMKEREKERSSDPPVIDRTALYIRCGRRVWDYTITFPRYVLSPPFSCF
jgi:hypothetical protein